jgi:hypothetical protein
MPWLPGWNSVEGAAKWENICFWAGIVCLVLLAVFEIISRVYSTRKDKLVAIAEDARVGQQQKKESQAEIRHATELATLKSQQSASALKLQGEQSAGVLELKREQSATVATLHNQLAQADEKLADLKKRESPRHLGEHEKAVLVEAISPFRGQKVSVVAVIGGDDALSFAGDFVNVFRSAHWDVLSGEHPSQAVFSPVNPEGVEVTINKEDTDSEEVLKPAAALVRALGQLSLAKPKDVFVNTTVQRGTIQFIVGFRPSPATP